MRRTFLAAVVAVAMLVLPWDVAVADPNGRGRDDPPGHARQEQEEGAEGSSETDPEEEDADEEAPNEARGSSGEEASGREAASDEDGEPAETGRGSDTSRRRPGTEAEEDPAPTGVALAVSVTPAQIERGETATIAIDISSAADVQDVDLLLDLPPHLEFRSASHPAARTTGTLRFDLGALAAEARIQVDVVVEGIADAGEPQAPVRVAVTADGDVVRDEVSIAVGDESESALALTHSAPLLVQVGDSAAFSLTLRNGSNSVVEDAVVVAEIAAELEVAGVTPIAQADAIQLGRSRSGEDIVWTFGELEPGQQIDLTWTARAVVAGDLEATMSAQASAPDAPTTSTTQTTYLGYVRGVRTTSGDPSGGTVVEERVVTKLVPVTRQVSGSAAGVLPSTGATLAAAIAIGLALIALGGTLLLLGGNRGQGRGVAVGLLAVLLTVSACVSDPDGGASHPPTGAATEAPPGTVDPEDQEDADDEDEQEDRVLGLRIEKERPQTGETDTTADPDPEAPREAPATEVVFEEVTTIERVLVPAGQPAAHTLTSRDGDNQVSIALAGGTPTITSSRVISADQTEELLVSAGGSSAALTATVSLRNLADRPLVVRGTLVLEIMAASGASSDLTSDVLNVELQPGGETSADFSFSLPPGEYTVTSAFRAY